MNIHVLSSGDYWVDLVPVVPGVNRWNTRFGKSDEIIGEVGGVLDKDQADSALELIEWGEAHGDLRVKARLATIFRRRYSELEEMGFEEVFSRGLALLETEND